MCSLKKNSCFGVQADFIEQLLHARFAQEQSTASAYTSYRWQVSIFETLTIITAVLNT
jgi:hypothetical protein